MPNSFRYHLLPVAVALLLAAGASACKPLCVGHFDLWVERGYTFEGQAGPADSYREPANVWIDSAAMAQFLVEELRWYDRQAIISKYRFDCSPSVDANCPDCVVCTRTVKNVRDHECRPVGEMLVRAYFGPGNTVRAQTYWRR